MTKTTTADVNSAKKYFKAIADAQKDGKRVIVTRTKEEARLVSELEAYTFANKVSMKVWDFITGWTMYGANTSKDPSVDDRQRSSDNLINPIEALRVVHAGTTKVKSDFDAKLYPFQGPGLYIMNYAHWPLAGERPDPMMTAFLKYYAHTFPTTEKLLILICPEGFTIPDELQDNVSIIDFELPNSSEHADEGGMLLDDLLHAKLPGFTDTDLKFLQDHPTFWVNVLKSAAGMTTARFSEALSGGLRQALEKRVASGNKNAPLCIDTIALAVALEKTEIVKQSQILEMMLPEQMSNIGGLDNLKEWIGLRAKCFSDEARAFGIDSPKGILMAGPPGTGKSLCAKAIANELKLPMFKFDISRVFDKYVGQSEAKIRAVLKTVDAMSPCVLLIDEIDKVFSTAQAGDSGVGTRVLGSLLTWMQETKSQVFVVMTANRVNALPSELVRKGRLDEIFSVSVPTGEEITEVVKIHLRKRGHNVDEISGLDVIPAAAEGYVAAELEAAVKEALIEAFTSDKPVTGEMIVTQLKHMMPLSKAFADDFKFMDQWANANARPASKHRKRLEVVPKAESKVGRGKRSAGLTL